MVDAVRDTEKLLGTVTYELAGKVKDNKKFARSLFVVKDIGKGEIITTENVRSIRPGYGLHPKYFEQILGKAVNTDLKRGIPLKTENISM
jgi:pseudaminic acid synthase